MYSSSNSFLGGNSMRPNPQQYGSSFNMSQGQQPQQQQQQPSPFAPQPTGFGQPPLQQQYTGFPGMQPQPTGMQPPQGPSPLQSQYTGFPGQGPTQQSFQTGAPPMPPIPQHFQQQFQQQQQGSPFSSAPPQQSTSAPASAPAPMKPQPTGFSQMAASFQSGGSSQPKPQAAPVQKKTNKIPNIRLSFITAQDQAKFETLFKSAVGEEQTVMSGEKARDLLLRSRLDGDSLSQIWCVFM
jgi:actin cytoskeleton-regulatory complex protein PAN1